MQFTFCGYNRPTTLIDFPTLIRFDTDLPEFSYDTFASPEGWDLRFYNSNLTIELNYEIEQWNPYGASAVWVQLPELKGTNTTIWATWGDPGNGQAPYTTNGATWSEGFSRVYHLNQSAGDAMDSTPNGFDAANAGIDYSDNGVIAGAAEARHFADSLLMPDLTSPSFSAEIWYYYAENDPFSHNTIFCRNGGTYHHLLIDTANGEIGFWFGAGGGDFHSSGVALDLNQWHHLVAMADGPNYTLYLNGNPILNDPGFFVNSASRPLGRISTHSGAEQVARGVLDEVRISDRTRSADWVWATWYSQASNQAFACASSGGLFPRIDNDTGATNVTATSALLQGTLVSTGLAPTEVWVLWGTGDGGSNRTAWAHTNAFGVQDPGAVGTNITGLAADTVYYYRYLASNAFGASFAPASAAFFTGEIQLNPDDPNASEKAGDTGQVTFTRPASATGFDMRVNYTVSGTAQPGLDVPTFSGQTLIPAGSTSRTIVVQPIDDDLIEPTETLSLLLRPGPYRIGSSSNATITIADNDAIDNFNHRMKIAFCGYTGSTTLSNIPLLV
ncbi:MAG: LamG-like jellyroll fold domain-containing protein, partial [Verrucomicrobiota bacterium]